MKDNQEIAKDYTDWMVKTGGYAKDMTMRDYFAGMAMLKSPFSPFNSDTDAAEWCYSRADAMLKERAK